MEGVEPLTVPMRMYEEDFDSLFANSSHWGDWAKQQWEEGRWEHSQKKYDEAPRFDWIYAYYMGDSWATVIMARSFLQHLDEPYEILWDMGENPGYVIITNYASPTWRKVASAQNQPTAIHRAIRMPRRKLSLANWFRRRT